MEDKIEIPVVHDDDLKKLLSNLGLDKKIDNGELFCPISNTQITWENIGAIISKDNVITIVCDLSECLEECLNKKSDG